MSLVERLLSKINKTDGCWEWTAARSSNGYGLLDDDDGKTRRAHRLMFELFIGPIGAGLELDHLCRNRLCVRPDHLEPVTHKENMRRAAPFRPIKTHCPNNHVYDEVNTCYVTTLRGTERRCRICKSVNLRNWRERHGN